MRPILKLISGIGNSVDPEKEQSDLGLHVLYMQFCQTLLVYEFLGHLP